MRSLSVIEPGRHDHVRRFDGACPATVARFGDLVRRKTVRVVSA